jgi:hypothetical protein
MSDRQRTIKPGIVAAGVEGGGDGENRFADFELGFGGSLRKTAARRKQRQNTEKKELNPELQKTPPEYVGSLSLQQVRQKLLIYAAA